RSSRNETIRSGTSGFRSGPNTSDARSTSRTIGSPPLRLPTPPPGAAPRRAGPPAPDGLAALRIPELTQGSGDAGELRLRLCARRHRAVRLPPAQVQPEEAVHVGGERGRLRCVSRERRRQRAGGRLEPPTDRPGDDRPDRAADA